MRDKLCQARPRASHVQFLPGDGDGPMVACDNGEMIPEPCERDGVEHCSDGSDEACFVLLCEPSNPDSEVAESSQQCDGNLDCPNGADERSCVDWWLCTDASDVIAIDEVCDGTEDCTDGSDESLCDMYICDDETVIPLDQVCDGTNDCDSDETLCTRACDGGSKHPGLWCNGNPDCEDGQDEMYCSETPLACPL